MKLSRTRNKPLVLSMALMVLMALVIPFAGIAGATHGGTTTAVELDPPIDTAATGTCNEFTVTATGENGAPAEGETVEIRAAQSDADTNTDLQIAFCDPDQDDTAPDTQFQGENLAGVDCDDDGLRPNGGPCPTVVAAGVENPAVIEDECITSTGGTGREPAGECTFGVTSNEPGEMLVEACVSETTTDQFGETTTTEICDRSQKNWVAGGAEAVDQLDCEPEAASNPEANDPNTPEADNQHTFTCTAFTTDAQGNLITVAGVQVQAVITDGPNEGRTVTCTQTNNEGVATCTYTNNPNTAEDVGTDTIVGFVNQDAPQGQTATAGPDAFEPQDTIFKTWFGEARVINCEPETASNTSGTQHVVTCTVTDREGQPVPGETVTFTEEGPGRFDPSGTTVGAGTTTTTATTNEQGVATVTTTTFENEEGIQDITGSLATDDPTQTGDQTTECERLAGDPTGAPAGACADSVVKNWVAAGEVEPQPECNDGVDNDGDGQIDFPNDPGCDSATDDNESDFPNQQFGGETGVLVTEGACAGFTTGSVQGSTTTNGLVIVGTNGPDALEGSNADDLICALDGDDAVQGLGGDDTIYGGGGKDGIEAGAGNDTVFGEGDKDIVLGDDGNDTLNGGQGNDNMSGGGDADVLRGQGGWDTLKGNAGNDLLVGAKGRDILQGGSGSDTVRGGADDDVLKGFTGNDVLRGGGGDDIIKGFKGQDRLFGNAGNDYLHGGPDNDFCRGGRGKNDVLVSCNP